MVTAARVSEAGSIVAVERISGIVKIFDRDVNAVIHRRRLDRAVVDDAAVLLAELSEPRKLVVEAGEHVAASLAQGLRAPAAITDDIAFWVGVVADLCDVPLVGVRLARAEAAMCPRFHVDQVLARVAIAYAGPGTELVAERAVDRSKLLPHHRGEDDEASGLILDPSAIWRAHTGDVVVMKGELWSADVGGVVHRSPCHTTPRLLLTLEPLG
ncbi:MAG: DUF1826 domain-containing protein [Kofleriaceae bacterium]|nr:DUF1826 domain-containing protein [Kofleriaceae bacterium]